MTNEVKSKKPREKIIFKLSISGPLINSYKKFIKIFIISILFSFSISNMGKRSLITFFIISFSTLIIFSVSIFCSKLVLKLNSDIKNCKSFSNFSLTI